jgi:hypothetical protein
MTAQDRCRPPERGADWRTTGAPIAFTILERNPGFAASSTRRIDHNLGTVSTTSNQEGESEVTSTQSERPEEKQILACWVPVTLGDQIRPRNRDRRVASCEKREGILAENAAPKIASRDEVLEMLTEKARQGYTGAMIALERALRAADRKEREELDTRAGSHPHQLSRSSSSANTAVNPSEPALLGTKLRPRWARRRRDERAPHSFRPRRPGKLRAPQAYSDSPAASRTSFGRGRSEPESPCRS